MTGNSLEETKNVNIVENINSYLISADTFQTGNCKFIIKITSLGMLLKSTHFTYIPKISHCCS